MEKHSVSKLSNVQLGDFAKDTVTGFKGYVTGLVDYLTGCRQVLLTPQVKEDGSTIDAHWFDVTRIVVLPDIAKIEIESDGHDGPDMPAPIR